jgi:hypothetical protein
MLFSPLEQFAVVSIFQFPASLFSFYLLTNYSWMLLIVLGFWGFLSLFLLHPKKPIFLNTLYFLMCYICKRKF